MLVIIPIVCAVLLFFFAIVCEHNDVKKLELRLERAEDRAAAVEAVNKQLLKNCEELRKDIDEFPIEQLQTIYDSEKQFQDGLNSILNYFGPAPTNNTDGGMR